MEHEQRTPKRAGEDQASDILHKHLDRTESTIGKASSPNTELINHFRKVKSRHLMARQWVRFLLKPVVMLGSIAIIAFLFFLNVGPSVTTTTPFDTTAHAREVQAVPAPGQPSVVRDSLSVTSQQPVLVVPQSTTPTLQSGLRNRDTLRIQPTQEEESASNSRRRPAQKTVIDDSVATVGR